MAGSEGVDEPAADAMVCTWIDEERTSPERMRRALRDFLEQWSTTAAALSPSRANAPEAIDDLAHTLASMRGHAVVPRVVRMPLADRARAYGYLVALFINSEIETERRRAGRTSLERMLGLRTGHAGGLAEAASLGLDPRDVSMLLASDELHEIVASSSDQELEYARLLVQLLVDWLPLLIPSFLSEFGAKGAALEELVGHVFKEPPSPELCSALAVRVLAAIRRQRIQTIELQRNVRDLTAGVLDVELLKLLPKSERQSAMARLPERRQMRIAAGLRARRG